MFYQNESSKEYFDETISFIRYFYSRGCDDCVYREQLFDDINEDYIIITILARFDEIVIKRVILHMYAY